MAEDRPTRRRLLSLLGVGAAAAPIAMLRPGPVSAAEPTLVRTWTQGGTVTAGDVGAHIRVNSPAGQVVRLPALPVGSTLEISRWGTGAVTITGSGVGVREPDGRRALRARYSVATVMMMPGNVWLLTGDLG